MTVEVYCYSVEFTKEYLNFLHVGRICGSITCTDMLVVGTSICDMTFTAGAVQSSISIVSQDFQSTWRCWIVVDNLASEKPRYPFLTETILVEAKPFTGCMTKVFQNTSIKEAWLHFIFYIVTDQRFSVISKSILSTVRMDTARLSFALLRRIGCTDLVLLVLKYSDY